MEFTESAFQSLIQKLVGKVSSLDERHVEVGIPSEKNARTEPGMNNASLGFIHEFGAPEANIPPRPFLIPGAQEALPEIKKTLKKDIKQIVGDKDSADDVDLNRVGLIAVNHVRGKFTTNDWPDLAESTKRQRKGEAPYQPLVDTGALRQAITYVIEDGKL